MSPSLASRLERLDKQVGWRKTILRDRDGREVMLPSLPLIDAYLYVIAHGTAEGSGLDPAMLLALARVPIRASMSDLEATLVMAARDLLAIPTGHGPRSPDDPPFDLKERGE